MDKNTLDFLNGWLSWVGARQQPTPQGYAPIQQHQGAPPTAFLKPEDMNAVLNAFSPYDLYMKPDKTPSVFDYPTTALNIHNLPNDVGVKDLIVLASEDPKSFLSMIKKIGPEGYQDIPPELRQFIPQGIYEHEVAHYNDPRLLTQIRNYGYMLRNGMEGHIAGREEPAMQAENRFWDSLINARR